MRSRWVVLAVSSSRATASRLVRSGDEPQFLVAGRDHLCDLALPPEPAEGTGAGALLAASRSGRSRAAAWTRDLVVAVRGHGREAVVRAWDLWPRRRAPAQLAAAPGSFRIGDVAVAAWHTPPIAAAVPIAAARSDDDRARVSATIGAIHVQAGAGDPILRVVGAAELARGVLVGRHPGCTISARSAVVSRVHLLIVGDRGSIWAIDAATKNGTAYRGRRIRQLELGHGTELVLGREVRLRWVAP
jgi:hypothetical protein